MKGSRIDVYVTCAGFDEGFYADLFARDEEEAVQIIRCWLTPDERFGRFSQSELFILAYWCLVHALPRS